MSFAIVRRVVGEATKWDSDSAPRARNGELWHYARLVARALHTACEQISSIANMVASAASDAPMPGDLVVAVDADRSIKARRLERLERFSPVSIDHVFADPSEARILALTPMCMLSLLFVYTELVTRNLWSARFHNGPDTGLKGDSGPVRTLATRHLSHPSTDGWNVVAGALALARAWALVREEAPRHEIRDAYDFSKQTRVRLAVCLCVAWKFERAMYTHFPRRFYTMEPSLLSPHTHELAFVGYSFFTLEEQRAFGAWDDRNSKKIYELYQEMIALEVDLLVSVNVMALMTRNGQVLAEERIAELLAINVVDAEAAMAKRAILPFLRIVSQDGKSALPNAGAFVCAAMLCVSVPTTVRSYVLHCTQTVREQFTLAERRGAYALLHKARYLKGLAITTVATTCYCDEAWVHYPFVCADALRVALFMAYDVSK